MVERLGISLEAARSANPCFKRGVLLGHIQLTQTTTLQTVLCRGECICCSSLHEATIADVLDQPVYGGNDYEDGGQEGAVQCEDCCGMYVTRLCEGRPSFDSGKFHNHCVDCPDFGQCIGDYREAHCQDCGKHWFAGNSGFPCSHCGGGYGNGRKSKPLSELPPPPLSAFDGVIEGAVDKVRERLPSTSNPLQRMMLQSLLAGVERPEELPRGGRSDVDASDVMINMLASMAGQDERNPMPPALRELVGDNPEALMAMMMAMMGSGFEGEEDDDEEEEPSPPRSKKGGKGKAKQRGSSSAAKKPRRGGGSGGGDGSGGGVSATFGY